MSILILNYCNLIVHQLAKGLAGTPSMFGATEPAASAITRDEEL